MKKLGTEDIGARPRRSELHNGTPKRVTTQNFTIIELMTVNGFHSKPVHGERPHTGAPKRV
jgi:hypothetical protein